MICGLKTFKDRLSEKYGFVAFTDPSKPAVAFGIYNQTTIDKMLRNDGMIIVVWTGTDAYDFCYRPDNLNWGGLTQKKNIKHIAISKWISDDLSKCGVPHVCLPVNVARASNGGFRPVPLGTKVYTYNFKLRPILYGKVVIDAVRQRMPDVEFIDIDDTKFKLPYTPDEMPKIYEQCFIGLRPTAHDGCSNTVVELGLMGRRCVHNGQLPGSIRWHHIEDVIETIRAEQAKIGTTNRLLAEQTAKYINVSEDWLDTEWWK